MIVTLYLLCLIWADWKWVRTGRGLWRPRRQGLCGLGRKVGSRSWHSRAMDYVQTSWCPGPNCRLILIIWQYLSLVWDSLRVSNIFVKTLTGMCINRLILVTGFIVMALLQTSHTSRSCGPKLGLAGIYILYDINNLHGCLLIFYACLQVLIIWGSNSS